MALQQVAVATNNLLESMGSLAVEVGEEGDKKNRLPLDSKSNWSENCRHRHLKWFSFLSVVDYGHSSRISIVG